MACLMTKSRIEKLRDKLIITEKEFLEEVSKLSNYGNLCNCNRELGTVKIVFQDSPYSDDIVIYCLSCGGTV